MTQKPAARHDTPLPESQTQRSAERDTLNDTPELRFLRDEIEALLGSPTVGRAMRGTAISYADDDPPKDPAVNPDGTLEAMPDDELADEDTAEFDGSAFARDTEPGADALRLREATRGASKP